MKNLKRALSLALASVMLLGMMVVGASAAEFKDADKIENVDAVNTMVALGVLKGKDTGDFDPAGIVTRAEMAKIICVMLSGGKEPNLGTSAAAYPDTGSHWANSYIAYCANLGIVAGDNHGKFNPDATVTGTEAAKMLLVALGYDSDVFAFTGASWAINVNTQANKAKLYDDVTGSANEGLSRDNAAQMAFNALSAYIMEKTYDKVQSNGQISYNYKLSDSNKFLNEYFDGMIFVGTYVGNHDTGASSTKGEITVNGKLDTAADTVANANASFPSTLDIANIGEQIKIIFKDGKGGAAGKPDKNDTIYGAFNTGVTQVEKVTKADIQDSESTTKLKFGGNKYDIASSVEVVTNYITGSSSSYTNAATLQGVLKVQSMDDIKFIYNDDGEISRAYVTNHFAGRVTGLTATKITISGVGSIELEDNNVAEDLKKDDVVVYTRYYDTVKDDAYFTVTKAESVEGELTGYKLDSTKYINVVVDGTTYKVETPATAIANLTDDAITAPASTNIGDTVRVYLAKGMAVAVQTIEGNAGQYALVTEVNAGILGSNMNPLKVAVLLADGTKETVIVHKDSTSTGSTAIDKDDLDAGTLVEYTSLANGTIKIKSAKDYTAVATVTGTTGGGAANVWDKTTKTLTHSGTSSAVASATAPAFVKVPGATTADDKYYAYSLRGLGNVANTAANTVKVSAYLDGGLVVASFLELTTKPGSSTADTLYGIVTGYVGTRTISDETFFRYTIAVGRDADLEVNVSTDGLTAGQVVKFDEATDAKYVAGDFRDLVTTSAAAAKNTNTIIAVKEYNESSRLLTYYKDLTRADNTAAFDGTKSSITVDKDVKIVYVNAKDKKAGEDVGVSAFDAASGYANAIMLTDSDGIVNAIVVETSGKVNWDTTNYGKTTTYTVNTPTAVTVVGNAGAYSATVATSPAVAGTTVTVTVTCTTKPASGTDTITLTGTGITASGTLTRTTAQGTGVVGTITFTMPAANVANLAIGVTNV